MTKLSSIIEIEGTKYYLTLEVMIPDSWQALYRNAQHAYLDDGAFMASGDGPQEALISLAHSLEGWSKEELRPKRAYKVLEEGIIP